MWRGVESVSEWYGDTHDLRGRFAAWQDGWRVVHDFPLLGTGINTYGTAMLLYQRSNEGFHLGSAHNDYLQVLAEGGLLVTVPAALAVVALIAAIRRNNAAARESRVVIGFAPAQQFALMAVLLCRKRLSSACKFRPTPFCFARWR